jgi:hypothetical protein
MLVRDFTVALGKGTMERSVIMYVVDACHSVEICSWESNHGRLRGVWLQVEAQLESDAAPARSAILAHHLSLNVHAVGGRSTLAR